MVIYSLIGVTGFEPFLIKKIKPLATANTKFTVSNGFIQPTEQSLMFDLMCSLFKWRMGIAICIKIDNIIHGAERLRFLVDRVHVRLEFFMRLRSHFSSFPSIVKLAALSAAYISAAPLFITP